MKKFIFLSVAILACIITIAQPPNGTAKKGMTFGAKTNEVGALSVNDLPGKVQVHRKQM